jgi:predicted nucleic acid-binding protein
VIDLATEIRANFGFTTPDAIHLAAAMVTKCDEFLTNDQRLQRFDEMRVVVIAKQN